MSVILDRINSDKFFKFAYIFTIVFFIIGTGSIGWDPPEFLGMGKYFFSFGEIGYTSWYRPPVWPLILGFIWRIGAPMPFSMQLLGNLIYFALPLITFLKFDDQRKYIGLLIASQAMFFRYSHMSLSHLPATLFLLLAITTSGKISGVFTALSGLSRFTFLLACPMMLLSKDWKKRATGMAMILVPYFLIMWASFGNPLYQLTYAQNFMASETAAWFWQGTPEFYIGLILKYSPLIIFAWFFSKKPSNLAFIAAFLYFTVVPHKEDRFLIDIFVFGAIALCERFDRIPIFLILMQMIYLPNPMLNLVSHPPKSIFLGIEDGSSVVAMETGVNAYYDVKFYPWFGQYSEDHWDADFCIFSRPAVPCQESDDFCISRVEAFYGNCSSWDQKINFSDNYILAKNPNS